MSEEKNVSFTEDRIPAEGLGEAVDGLIELYGGTLESSAGQRREFTLPLRRGVAAGGGIRCSLTWSENASAEATVTLNCDRDVDAPRPQRVLMLVAGVIGAVMFMLWPFYPNETAWGSLAWLGGLVAFAVYLMTLRRSSGGIAYDFLQRLAAGQRAAAEAGAEPTQG